MAEDPAQEPEPVLAPEVSVLDADVIKHTELPTTAISRALDGLLRLLGDFVSWFWLAIIGVIIYGVVGRYAFGQGSVTIEELQWHIAGATWLVGLSYTVVHDAHVRVDVLHERFDLRTKTWIEFLGILILLLPFLIITLWESIPYFWSSYLLNERSQAPAGLPARWAIKIFVPIAFGLLIVAAVSRLTRCTALIFGFPRPSAPSSGNAGQ